MPVNPRDGGCFSTVIARSVAAKESLVAIDNDVIARPEGSGLVMTKTRFHRSLSIGGSQTK
jgi:hypothetical protein